MGVEKMQTCPIPRTTLQRNLDIIFAARQRQQQKIVPPPAPPQAPALSQGHKPEGQGTHTDLTPAKVQKLVRTCGVFAIAKMLKKRGLKLHEARQLMGV